MLKPINRDYEDAYYVPIPGNPQKSLYYDVFGNYVYGAQMKYLGISETVSLWGSWVPGIAGGGPDEGDDYAIRIGYNELGPLFERGNVTEAEFSDILLKHLYDEEFKEKIRITFHDSKNS